MQPGDQQRWEDKVNQKLEKSARLSTYANAQVLLVSWEGEEPGFKKEGDDLGRMFRETFLFSTQDFEIPLADSHLRTHHFITQSALTLSESVKNTKGSALLIIHYGGHADRNDRKHDGEEKRAVWCTNAKGVEHLLPWYKIQEDLQGLDIDLLLLFDCCFAAQAGRADDSRLGRFELLAAAPMGMVTPKPGPKSFTVALMNEVATSFQESGVAIIKDIQARLVVLQARLHATPVHVPLRAGKRSIRLEKLATGIKPPTFNYCDGESMKLVVQTRDSLDELDEDTLVQWLGEDRPRIITSVKVLDTARHIKSFVQSMEHRDTPLTKSVNALSTDDILKTWETMTMHISQLDSLRQHHNLNIPALRSHAQNFLDRLDAMNNDFAKTLGRSVISICNNDDQETIQQALQDPISGSIGILNALRLRQIIYSAHTVQTDLVEDEGQTGSQQSLQEVKSYGGYFTEEEKKGLRLRIRHLAVLLSAPKDRDFQSLRCYRCEHKPFERRYILHFEIPPAYELPLPSEENITLINLIEKAKKTARPSLDERLKMAHSLSKAVHNWHAAGWLHQGIASPNVRFLRLKNSASIDFSQPFLQGFEFARPDSDPSLGRPTSDPYFDVYRHPSRQGPARTGHSKIHDYYALGVVLLEIGLWQSVTRMLNLSRDRLSPDAIREALQTNCRDRLAHYAGNLYQEAVIQCLDTRFGVELDDYRESRLMAGFHEDVVVKLASGVTVK